MVASRRVGDSNPVVVYGLSTEGYQIASSLAMNHTPTILVDERLQVATEVGPETVSTYSTARELIEEESLLGIRPIDVTISETDAVFFTPKIRRPGEEAKKEWSSMLSSISKSISKGTIIFSCLPVGFGVNSEMIEIVEVQDLLRSHEPELSDCVCVGWRRWQEFAPRFASPSARTRANVVNEFIVEEARRRFGSTSEVDVVDPPPRFLLRFGGRVLVQFKKVDCHLRSRNYPTQLALAFDRQYHLTGIPEGARITIGYLLDDLAVNVQSVHAILRAGSRIAWSYELRGATSVKRPEVLALDTPSTALVRVSRKRADKEGKSS